MWAASPWPLCIQAPCLRAVAFATALIVQLEAGGAACGLWGLKLALAVVNAHFLQAPGSNRQTQFQMKIPANTIVTLQATYINSLVSALHKVHTSTYRVHVTSHLYLDCTWLAIACAICCHLPDKAYLVSVFDDGCKAVTLGGVHLTPRPQGISIRVSTA